MESISSYYIKTLFLWRVDKVKDKKYWTDRTSKLFREMVGELCDAIAQKNIPYFWNKDLNLISAIEAATLEEYEKALTHFISRVDAGHTVSVVARLLTIEEMKRFYRLNNLNCEPHTNDSDTSNIQQEPAVNKRNKPAFSKYINSNIGDINGNIGDLTNRLKDFKIANSSVTNPLESYESKGLTCQDTKADIEKEEVLPCSKDFDGDERPKRFKYNGY